MIEIGKPSGTAWGISHRRFMLRKPIYPAIFVLLVMVPVLQAHSATRTRVSKNQKKHEQESGVLRLAGKTQAVQSRTVIVPQLSGEKVGTLTLTWLVPNGTHVKRGDMLAKFDRASQIQNFMKMQAKASDQNDKVIEAQAKEIANQAKDKTDIIKAEDSLRKAKLEMRKISILSRIDAEKTRENLKEAEATLAQLRQTYKLKRKAAEASIHILELQQDLTRQNMLHAKANAALLEIRSRINGIVVYKSIWKEGTLGDVQEGDQVRPGVPFMHVVDPKTMEVQVKVNQEDLFALHEGQKARVYLDAYPNLVFPARLESIDPMGKQGDLSPRLRTFAATFLIQGSNSRLMPDLSAAVAIHPSDAATGEQP